MTTSARPVALALTAALALASTGGAQEPATPVGDTQEPATPVGDTQEPDWEEEFWAEPPALLGYYETWSAIRLRELRWAAARGDRWALEEYVRRHFLPGQAATGEQPVVERLLDEARLGDLTYWSYLGLSAAQSSVMMRSPSPPDRWLRLGVSVEEQPPHRVSELQLEPVTAEDAPGGLETFPEDQLPRRLELLVEALCGFNRFSGAVLLARARGAQHHKVVLRTACGYAIPEGRVENTVDTQFDLPSLDQMFTAVVVARLVEQGKLAFDDPIERHLDGWVAPEVGEAVTVHHLLTHTSGLGGHREGAQLLPRGHPLRDLGDYKPVTLVDRPVFEPGSAFRESTNGYLLLGAIIESVSGHSYEECVYEYVRGPAMMTDTDLSAVDEIRGERALGYFPHDGEDMAPWPVVPGPSSPWRTNILLRDARGTPAGGGWSTVDDLLSFALRLQQARFVSEEMTEILLAPKVELSPGGRARSYGFEVLSTPDGGRVWGLSGETPGASALLEVHEDRGYVLVVLSNVSGGAWTVGEMFHHLLMRTER